MRHHRHQAQRAVQSLAGVEQLDVLEEVASCFIAAVEAFMVGEIVLE